MTFFSGVHSSGAVLRDRKQNSFGKCKNKRIGQQKTEVVVDISFRVHDEYPTSAVVWGESVFTLAAAVCETLSIPGAHPLAER